MEETKPLRTPAEIEKMRKLVKYGPCPAGKEPRIAKMTRQLRRAGLRAETWSVMTGPGATITRAERRKLTRAHAAKRYRNGDKHVAMDF